MGLQEKESRRMANNPSLIKDGMMDLGYTAIPASEVYFQYRYVDNRISIARFINGKRNDGFIRVTPENKHYPPKIAKFKYLRTEKIVKTTIKYSL